MSKEEKEFGKKTKEIWDRAEANLTAGLGAAIEEEKQRMKNPPPKKDEG